MVKCWYTLEFASQKFRDHASDQSIIQFKYMYAEIAVENHQL